MKRKRKQQLSKPHSHGLKLFHLFRPVEAFVGNVQPTQQCADPTWGPIHHITRVAAHQADPDRRATSPEDRKRRGRATHYEPVAVSGYRGRAAAYVVFRRVRPSAIAAPGDTLDGLVSPAGAVGRAWAAYTRRDPSSPGAGNVCRPGGTCRPRPRATAWTVVFADVRCVVPGRRERSRTRRVRPWTTAACSRWRRPGDGVHPCLGWPASVRAGSPLPRGF